MRGQGIRLRWLRWAGLLAALGLAFGPSTLAAPAQHAGGSTAQSPNAAQPGWYPPVALPSSSGLGEPSLLIGPGNQVYVTAPHELGNIDGGGSPVWASSDGGASFAAPAYPLGDAVSGGDTDLALGPSGDVYQADLWLGNAAMAVSTDQGASFVANEYGHVQPGDDRPWLAYSPAANALYLAWDGYDGIHVGKTLALTNPDYGLFFPQDVVAVPECVLGGDNPCSTAPIRQCMCPPGGIAVDHDTGEVYVSYSRQNGGSNGGGVGIAYSTDGGLLWSYSSVPGTGSTGSAFDTEYNFDPIAVDSRGNVYVAWGEGEGINSSGVATRGVQIDYAYSTDHGATWSRPAVVSTTTSTNVFPTLAVVSPGTVDVGYLGSSAVGDPNSVPASTSWDLVFATTTRGLAPSPVFTPQTAVSDIHTGCIQVGGLASCSDRSLLDFFQLATTSGGLADIAYTAGNAHSGTTLFVLRQDPPRRRR